jgi:hypothetical protein
MNNAAMNMNFHKANKQMIEAIEALNIARGLTQAARLIEGDNKEALQNAADHLENATRNLYAAASLAGSLSCAVELKLN